ncbi:MAG: cytidine deaminase [Spirochaetia bacterium]|nr:cytidine deaminase [Spirochaetia bacterium]
MNYKEKLISSASEAALKAYAPYSNFRVGAAVLADDGNIYTGVNVENRSYGLTICAERNAIFHGVAMGMKSIKAVAIFSPDSEDPLPPCGACRQVITEFSAPDAVVICCGSNGNSVVIPVPELYPMDSLHNLKKN